MGKRMRARQMLDVGQPSLIPIMNLVCLLIPFLLYTAAFVQFACIHVASPRFQNRTAVTPPDDEQEQALSLMLIITDQGFRLAASGGVLPEGCASSADEGGSTSAPTVPLNPNAQSCTDRQGYPSGQQRQERSNLRLGPPACAYDFGRLRECIQRIHEEYPDERQIIISGENRIDYDVLINSMDATRGLDTCNPHANPPVTEGCWFPEVILSSGVA
jgi:hypothetical protein